MMLHTSPVVHGTSWCRHGFQGTRLPRTDDEFYHALISNSWELLEGDLRVGD